MSTLDLEARRRGIGGSDIAVLLGVNPFKTPYELYEEKVNGLQHDFSNNEKVMWGHLLEEPIAKRYEQLTGKEVITSSIVSHPEYPFLLANPDRLIAGKKHGLEIKAVGWNQEHNWGESGSEKIPEYYHAQISHYMLVLDYDRWDVAALIGGQELRLYSFYRDFDMDEEIIKVAADFWLNHVEKKIEPLKDYAKYGVQHYIKKKYSVISESSIELSQEYLELANQLEELKELSSVTKKKQCEVEAKILDAIGEAGKAILPDGRVFCRKRIERKAYQVPASSYNTLTLKEMMHE